MRYWYLYSTDGTRIDVAESVDKNTREDLERRALGNFFFTEQEARKAVRERCRFIFH